MKIITDTVPMGLRLTNDREEHTELLMEWDQQLDLYSFAIHDSGEVQPQQPIIRRRRGESDDTFYDRACSMAMRIYLDRLTERIETMSRYERMQPLIEDCRNKLYHMIGVLDHWDNDKPTEIELEELQMLRNRLFEEDETLSTLS